MAPQSAAQSPAETIVPLLAPLREPAPVSWWPPAPGWWILAVCALIAVLALARWLLRRYRAGAPLRAAKRELAALAENPLPPAQSARLLAELLKRFALTAAVDAQAELRRATGSEWVTHLNALTADGGAKLRDDFATLAYRPQLSDAEILEAMNDSAAWLDAVELPR